LDGNKLFQPSALAPAVQEAIATGFAELIEDLPMAAHYQLEFRHAPAIGPNAFALPGGIIAITDEMITLSESVEEVLAVLAHEIGHVERRHALRHVLQDSATAAIAATFTSDAASLTLAVSGLPVLLAQTKYSREFETEADEYGFAVLKRHGLSPEDFASLMQRLSANRDEKDERKWSFLSTHPVTDERIARARAAAQN
jgi:predicted Zn-dependent protease